MNRTFFSFSNIVAFYQNVGSLWVGRSSRMCCDQVEISTVVFANSSCRIASARGKAFIVFGGKIACVFFLLYMGILASVVYAHNGPQWWVQRGVFSGRAADDFAVANIGQLKHMASRAAAELNGKLSGGAGAAINNLVASWQQPPPVGVVRNDFAPLTTGQLKAVGELFYARLGVAGIIPVGRRPWRMTGRHPDHAAVANLGQLKAVFSFVAQVPGVDVDENGNGIRDAWELMHFGNLSRSGNETISPGGLRVRDAYAFGLDPNTVNDGTAAGPNGTAPASPQVDIFAYDSRGWLSTARRNTTAIRSYLHDAEGNITQAQ